MTAAALDDVPATPLVATTARDRAGRWITDRAWISGVAGVVATVVIALVCQRNLWLDKGILWQGEVLVRDPTTIKLICLLFIAGVMCITEWARLFVWRAGPGLSIHPDLRQGRYLSFLLDNAWRYLLLLLIFWLSIQLYTNASEYGFARKARYYQGWFTMMDWLWTAFLWAGLPYILLTRALLHDPDKDAMSYHVLVEGVLKWGARYTPFAGMAQGPAFTPMHKKVVLGLLVRLFFAPLMTVFFINQFGSMVQNLGYAIEWLPRYLAEGTYTHERFNQDITNLGKAVIFTIDVGLAWTGYVLTSRWLDNETRSTEPTLLGWIVCLISYPPFQLVGLYLAFPSEDYILRLGSPWFITFFSLLALISFAIYTSATVVFGPRFSNLTHRGIIRTGPFAIVRHPAYASKNIGWWLCIFPTILFLFVTGKVGIGFVLGSTLGLAAQTYWYYLRALTEERHLSQDPDYLAYCQQVKYRFVPGVV